MAWRRRNGKSATRKTPRRISRPNSPKRRRRLTTKRRCAHCQLRIFHFDCPALDTGHPGGPGTHARWNIAAHRIANAGEVSMAKSGFAAGQLKSLVERVERLEEEKAALTADIREIFAEAKGGGFDTKIMRQVIRIRRLDKADRQEQEAILDLYLSALGMRN